jgi:hypothetical protein
MTFVLGGCLLVALWLARPRPLLPRNRGVYLSEKWRLDHLYNAGKNGKP